MRTWLISICEEGPLEDGDPVVEEAVRDFVERFGDTGHRVVATCTPRLGERGGTEGCSHGSDPAVVAPLDQGQGDETVA